MAALVRSHQDCAFHHTHHWGRGSQTGGGALKILAVNWRDIKDPLAGGAEIHLHEILRYCVARGHQVDLVVAAYPGAAERDEIDGVRVYRRGHWLVANYVLPGMVRSLMRERRYDLLVEDINKIPFYTPLYRRGVPVLAIVPHLFGSTVFREANPFVATYVWSGERAIPHVYRQVAFEVISPSTATDLVARGIPRDHIRTILCGIDHVSLTLTNPPARNDTPLVVTWSRLRRYKSIDVAIRAFALIIAKLPEARMLVIGSGPDAGRLQRLVRRLDLADRITFRGYLPWEELVQTLHRCHVCLNPSPKEGWGLTVIEANQCGLPVVASDRPGLCDSVRDGETGYLVPYGDAEAFAAAALRLLTDPALLAAQRNAAREWAGRFSWDRCARESLAYFQEVAGCSTGGLDDRGAA